MLIKRSRKNQVALPKAVLERAGVGPGDLYFLVDCEPGAIILRPVDIEERIPLKALARFKAKVLKGQPGDKSFGSMEGLIKDLKRKA